MQRHVHGARTVLLVLCAGLGCVQVLAVIGVLFWATVAYDRGNQPVVKRLSSRLPTRNSTGYPANPSSFRPASRVYPYSIISGGIEGVQDLKNAIAVDRVVAEHYEGFDLANARLIPLDRDREVYVSYRRGQQAYWTTQKIKLNLGETLITDGSHTARARCGNLISEMPKSPTFVGEPTPSVLDTPLSFDDPALPPMVATFVPQETMESENPGFPIFFPLVPFFPGAHPLLPPGPTPPPPPPKPVPEPGTLILVAIGLSSIWILRKR